MTDQLDERDESARDDAADHGVPETGDQAVDAALSVLDGLAARPVREHVAVFEAVHGALSDRLAEQHG